MIRTLVLIGLLVGAGCGKKHEIEGHDDAAEVAPTMLGCPRDTVEVGGMPPEGTDLWCSRTAVDGSIERHGPARTWWSDGHARSIGAYVGGQRTGHWWFFDPEGRVEKEGDFRDDLEAGYWMHYREDGSVAEEGPMAEGGRHGTWVHYDDVSGTPQVGTWVEGEKDGVWVEYDAEGKPLRERVYRRGRQISQREL